MAEMTTAERVMEALEDLKGVDIQCLDVRGVTTITDWMVIASGNSDRHVKALADSVLKQARADGMQVLGMEGEKEGEWVLIDLGEVIAHVMLPRVRDFYKLEKLWSHGEEAGRKAES